MKKLFPIAHNCIFLMLPLTIALKAQAPTYYSQFGQDEFLCKHLFKEQKGGFFVDIGAHDGISYSNTYFLEKNLGWHGICVEPQPAQFLKLQKNRSALCLRCCIFDKDGETEFLQADGAGLVNMFSGITETYPQEQLAVLDSEIKNANGRISRIKIKTRSLNSICQELGIRHINLLAIDTEGSELKIIEAISFEKVSIDVIMVENNNEKDDRTRKLLASHGYRYIKRLWIDDVFCTEKLFKNL